MGCPVTWTRPFEADERGGFDAEVRRDLLRERVERLARRDAGSPAMIDAAVVLPPDAPLTG